MFSHFGLGLGLFVPVDPQGSKSENYPSAEAIAEERAAHIVHESGAQ